jgi:flagellar hook-basal body complex protein FliE
MTPAPISSPSWPSFTASGPGAASGAEPRNRTGFAEVLRDSIEEVGRLQNEADRAIQELATGREPDVHNTMIAMQKASVAFELMMQVRNKVVAAYEEIARMQV